jgi:hypothetical protein
MKVYIPQSKALTFSNGRWSGGGEQKPPISTPQPGKVEVTCNQLKTVITSVITGEKRR